MKGKVKCHYCGKEFEIDETEYMQKKELYNDFVCDKCVENHTCQQCGEIVDQLFEEVDLMIYVCRECANANKINRLESLFS